MFALSLVDLVLRQLHIQVQSIIGGYRFSEQRTLLSLILASYGAEFVIFNGTIMQLFFTQLPKYQVA
jgi:hypothetical protein